MYDMVKRTVLAAVLAALVLPGIAVAGFIIQDQDYAGSEPELKSNSTSWIQKNRLKFQNQDEVVYYVWNLENGTFQQVNTVAKAYTSGTFAEEIEALKKYMAQFMEEEEGSDVAPGEDAKKEVPESAVTPQVKITKTGETATIAGLSSVKYEVRQDGELVEEIWIAKELDISGELDYKKFKKVYQDWMKAVSDAISDIDEEGKQVEWYETDEYLRLFDEGYAVKQVELVDGDTYVNEIVKVEKKEIPASEFEIPQGYRKVTSQEFMELEEE